MFERAHIVYDLILTLIACAIRFSLDVICINELCKPNGQKKDRKKDMYWFTGFYFLLAKHL